MRSAEAGRQHETGGAVPGLVHREIRVDDGAIHGVEVGSGRALVLVHGGHGSWTHWAANLGALARSCRVIALDLPGFGASFRPRPDYDTERYAQVITEVLDALRIEDAALAGFSFGGLIAAEAARREPHRVHRLVLVNPPGIGPPSPEAARVVRQLTRLSLTSGLRAGAAASLRRLQLYNHDLIDDALIDAMMANVRRTRFVSRRLSALGRTDALLQEVPQPVLLLIGREDVHRRFGLAEGLAELARCRRRVQVWLVERSAHWLQYDRARLFNDLVADFVR